MLYGVVESVKRVECIKQGLDFLEVMIGFDKLSMFGDYGHVSGLIGENVQYEVRPDMYKGQQIDVIANVITMNVVQTVESKEHIKLIPVRSSERAVCTIDISSPKFGDIEYGCIGFLCGYAKGQSKKAYWIDCEVVDKFAKVFTLRIFTREDQGNGETAEEIVQKLVGRYIRFTVKSTSYGYQTDSHDIELYNVPVVIPPEVELAVMEINQVLQTDADLREFVDYYDLIERLKGLIHYELGYHLVEIAAELRMIDAVSDISATYDVKTLRRAAICSRVYLIPGKIAYSKPILNTMRVLKTGLKADRELLVILDVLSNEEVSPTKQAYIDIAKFVQRILSDRREVDITDSYRAEMNTLSVFCGNLV